ncbi:unnamed protein product [Musa acuminata subsp. malaccensis]|uniref:(wild Malaysian banana) hypothetical protein n=1 Tax=Musa acuminata subsp. malaccensis TaxID=214687 RepID=A0A804IE73_MUSAM|nr:PREDICTED: uncharacterized protein LOC103979629 [Musa acuminata subsp. malaccensis]CAG1850747.1 unnamed protein product [Musa acuminata subsp. malaccensis]
MMEKEEEVDGNQRAGQEGTMDLPLPDPGPVKEDVLSFSCDQCDKETVHKIAQLLNPGLAGACVDNTTGLFRGPATVAVLIRKEMVDYITPRSETFVAETMAQGDGNADPAEEASDDPADIVSDIVDEFARSKRNFFSRVSAWILSDSREDKIDDFVQEMETNAFWPMDRREVIAETLLRNVDFKNAYHCSMKFESEQQLAEHRDSCGFRIAECTNDGCRVKFSAAHREKHDAECPFKILPCEQKCPESIMRREMDRHCITVCPMKLMNCPFYQIGCQSAFPQCTLEKHCEEFLHSHLLYVLQVIHKQEVSEEEMEQRAQLLEKSECQKELSEALDVRSLTMAVKEQEAKMKKLERDLSIAS